MKRLAAFILLSGCAAMNDCERSYVAEIRAVRMERWDDSPRSFEWWFRGVYISELERKKMACKK